MIARHEVHMEQLDIWSKLAAPLPAGVISWRQDGRPVHRDGRWLARFVAYIEANTVRERLDSVVPGEWDLTLELLPPLSAPDEGGEQAVCSFKARLQILGVIREDVGTGRDYKQAATDAFKRAAVRFGIAHELYALEQNWVVVDGDGRSAKPLEDPQTAYTRRYGVTVAAGLQARAPSGVHAAGMGDSASDSNSTPGSGTGDAEGQPVCPRCEGRMWDNRETKRNPRAPDYKCRDRSCDGVIWPPKPGAQSAQGSGSRSAAAEPPETEQRELQPAVTDAIPF